MNSELGRKLASVALIIGMFVVWELLCLIFLVSDVVLPRPSQVFITLWQRAPALWPHTMQTLYTTMLGFVLGVAIGVVIGVVIGWSKLAYDVAYPLLIGPQGRPALALYVEDHETAATTLTDKGFTLFTENDLNAEE